MGSSLGAIIGPLFDSKPSPAQDKKRARKPKSNAVTKGEKSVTEPAQQHGELPAYKEPTPIQQVRDHAKREKVHATRAWVSGHMTTEEHNRIHRRADHVLKGKHPKEYKGKTGEKAGRKVIW